MLNFNLQGVTPTQDWTSTHAVFNSLADRDVRVSFGCWDGESGEGGVCRTEDRGNRTRQRPAPARRAARREGRRGKNR